MSADRRGGGGFLWLFFMRTRRERIKVRVGKNNCSLGMKLQLCLFIEKNTVLCIYILKVASRRSFSTTTTTK
jgi:hypothetical protein